MSNEVNLLKVRSVIRPTYFAERVADVVVVFKPFLHLDGQIVGKLQLTVGVRTRTHLHLQGSSCYG